MKALLITLVVLALIASVFNLIATHDQIDSNNAAQRQEQQSQQIRGEHTLHLLCGTFERLAARRPPPGNPLANPSRGYLQWLHQQLAQVAPDLKCETPSR